MKHLSSAAALCHLPWRWLDRLGSTAMVSGPDHRLLAVNDAWDEFARANRGESLLAGFPLGSHWIDAVSDPELRRTLDEALDRVRRTGEVWSYDYDCSSPAVERRFRLRAYSVLRRSAVLLVHDPVFIGPAERTLPELCDDNGILSFCLACERVSVRGQPDAWVAVELGDRLPSNASAGLCPTCFELAPAGIFGGLRSPPLGGSGGAH